VEPFFNVCDQVEKKLGYRFKNSNLLAIAFVHRSYFNEHPFEVKEHNERLEFLGDSVLGLIAAEYLYLHLPDLPEGVLSDLRARLVEASSCMHFLQKLNVEPYLLLGKGEKRNAGRGRESILANLFEAIIGAIYLDGGLYAAKQFFLKNFKLEIESILKEPARNWKAELQDYSQKKYQITPVYEVIDETGPAHQKHFRIAVYIDKTECGAGEGSSKKEAQQNAAKDALNKILERNQKC
jgi:ribonuclease III